MKQSNTKKSSKIKKSKSKTRSAQKKHPNNSNIYDDVFRTMEVRCTKLMLPLINEAFSENYSLNEKIVPMANEHFISLPDDEQKKRETDSNISVTKGDKSKKYHFECQSTVDSSILVRFCEYDSEMALEDRELGENILHVNYPSSALLYLRTNSNTPDNMDIEAGMSLTPGIHRVVVIKMNNYSLDEIFEKQLWILLPFYIFTYEKKFAQYDTDENLRKKMCSDFRLISECLEELSQNKTINSWEYALIMSLTRRVVKHIASKYKNIRKEIRDIMGGRVLYDTELDVAWEKGLKKGISEGRLETLFGLYKDGLLSEKMLLSRAEKEGILDEVKKRLKKKK